MKLLMTFIIGTLNLVSFGQIYTSALSDSNIALHLKSKGSYTTLSKNITHDFSQVDSKKEVQSYLYLVDIKSAFLEALISQTVRMNAIWYRNNSNKTNIGNHYLFNYHAEISDSVITREVCSISFPGLPKLTTINYKLVKYVNLSEKQLRHIVEIIALTGLKISDIHISIPYGGKYKIVKFIEAIGLKAYPLIDKNNQGGIKISLKMSRSI